MTGAPTILALGAIVAIAAGQLPPPPGRAVFRTRSFGDVTLDHAAHLARRAPCRSCHGDGPIKKVEQLGKERGHEVCRGCHVELDRGPIKCLGCHVVGSKRRGGGEPEATPTSAGTTESSAPEP